MLKRLLYSSFVALFLLTAGGCDDDMTLDSGLGGDGGASTRTGIVQIMLGETIILQESGIAVTFSTVNEESRCPEDVQCVTAGRAVIGLHLSNASVELPEVELEIPGLVETPFSENDQLGLPGISLKLVDLTPYPNVSDPSSEPYVASIQVLN
jgi:hypothetical protein